jgi:transcriptional regulator GlxA family with amidase domain
MKVSFVLYPGVEPIDLAALGVFSMARRVIPELRYETLAATLAPVTLSNGLSVLPDRTFGDPGDVDVLMIPGGPGWREAARDEALLALISKVAPQATVASICTGAMVVAATGLLRGRRATTKKEVVDPERSPLEQLRDEHPEIEVVHALLIDEGQILMGGGVCLCIDTALHLLESRYGRSKVAEIERILEYSAAREANRRRFAEGRSAGSQSIHTGAT